MKRFKFITEIILYLIYLISSFFLIKELTRLEEIENTLRFLFIIIIIILNIFLIIRIILLKKKKKKINKVLIIVIILSLINIILAVNINRAYHLINNFNKEELTYSSVIITLKDNKKKLNDMRLGILKNEKSYEGYIIPKLIIEEKKLINNPLFYYDDFISIITALYDHEIDAGFFPSNYLDTLKTNDIFENIQNDVKIIYTKKEKLIKQNLSDYPHTEKNLSEPFSLLLIGIDSTEDNINSVNSFNGDALILLTFNPQTLNATIWTIPRDTYVPIACFKNKASNKITHAAWYGEECIIKTIENLINIPIDYYVKVNFKSVVNLVDTLGGIDIDVPFSFCEQDSNRLWGDKTIFIKKGYQTLNGEQVLAFARHRKETSYMAKYCGKEYLGNKLNDLVRGENQQLILHGLFNKVKTINNLNKIYNLLETVNQNIDTNITTNQILSLYNIFKDITLKNENNVKNIITTQRLYLSGYDQYIYDEAFKMALYNYMYYEKSLEEITKAMKINLNLDKVTLIKDFNYSIKDPYEEEIIGKGKYSKTNYIDTLPNFVGENKSSVDAWAMKKKFTIKYLYQKTNNYSNNEVIKQDYPYAYILKKISSKTLTITLAQNFSDQAEEKIDCLLEENLTKKACLLPDFTGWTLTEFDNWYSKLNNYHINLMTPIKESIASDDEKEVIVYQNKEAGIPLKDIVSLKITYNKKSA